MIARLGHVLGWTFYAIAAAILGATWLESFLGNTRQEDAIAFMVCGTALFLMGRAILYVLSGE